MKTILAILILSFTFTTFSQAEFVPGEGLDVDDSETVIVDSYISDLSLEEPVFSSRKSQRDIAASASDLDQSHMAEWQGQLSVVKEIPYSYPWISHNTLSLRVLNEIENED